MDKSSIALIIPYFGKFPSWFNIYLETCKANPTVDFLFFTDNESTLDGSPNIKFVNFSLERFNRLASQKLNLEIEISEAYKVCDFKPAYGVIFEDFLFDYTFWGHTDIDVILGDIRHFINLEMLAYYDIITAKKEYLVGHFTLYRNCKKVNGLYLSSKNYELVFKSDQSFSFDECNRLWQPLLNGLDIQSLKSDVESMTHVVIRLSSSGYIKSYFETISIEQDKYTAEGELESWDDTMSWKEGKLINLKDEKEYMYFHFHILKKSKKFLIPAWKQVPNAYFITKSGFSLLNNFNQ